MRTLLVLAPLLFLPLPGWAADVVLYVVRHAEKATSPASDPPLTDAGRARAEDLARTLADVPLAGVHSTATTRTRTTAAAAASARKLEVQVYDEPAALIARIRTA